MNNLDITHWQNIVPCNTSDFGVKIIAAIAFSSLDRRPLADRHVVAADRQIARRRPAKSINRFALHPQHRQRHPQHPAGDRRPRLFRHQTTTFAALLAAAGVSPSA